jgi:signal transduction histidine kinase
VASAGPDRQVRIGQPAVLDGRGSFDPDGDLLYFFWEVLAAPEDGVGELAWDQGSEARLEPDVSGVWVVRLRVGDSGPGIAQEHLERVFDPFFTTSETGLGLGLSISYTIVKRLGGSLTAANASGDGAVFTLTLAAWSDRRAQEAGN